MAASAQATMCAINDACRKRGGSYASYSCKVVSWDDVSRGTAGGSLSCWGANITDTYLKSKEGQQLFTVRSDNWNEKLGTVPADRVAVVASRPGQGLAPVTLKGYLERLGEYGGYAGLDAGCSLYDASLDSLCSIRFQTTFLPASSEGGLSSRVLASLPAALGGRAPAKVEFCTEAYNYNTMSDDDPRNLILLCTTQGVAVQQDGRGAKKLLHHAVDDGGKTRRYWLEAEETRHQVGGEQRETLEERQDALARGKATASVIGTEAMGQRFNVLMTIQVPLKQQKPTARNSGYVGGMSLGLGSWGSECCDEMQSIGMDLQMLTAPMCASPCTGGPPRWRSAGGGGGGRPQPPAGRSSAARVSRGSEYDACWGGVSVAAPARHESEHATVTVVIYNTVADGVPSEEDVARAIDDMEGLYAATAGAGRLAGPAFDFMKAPLQAQDAQGIQAKLAFQPPAQPVQNFDVFPTS